MYERNYGSDSFFVLYPTRPMATFDIYIYDTTVICPPSVAEPNKQTHDMRRYTMKDLIDRQEAINVLEKIKAQKENCNCSRQRLREAQAIGYAIAVIKKIKRYEERG